MRSRLINSQPADAGPLWAITSYYNPMRYARRRYNYRLFRERLGVPLVAVELSFDGRFDLGRCDAEILLRRRGGDVLWQKERLLNLAVKALPRSCEQVLWIDCDTHIPRPGWTTEVSRRLKDVPLLQPFSVARHLEPDANPHELSSTRILFEQPAATGLIEQGRTPEATVGRVRRRGNGSRAPGFAWAARRELLECHGLYDAAIVGGGDTAVLAALYGVHEESAQLLRLSDRHTKHYAAWAQKFHRAVRGKVACLPGDLLHFWHGDIDDRRTYLRYLELARHDFDPAVDMRIDDGGCWRWNSEKPAMHKYLREYFAQRKEDGVGPHADRDPRAADSQPHPESIAAANNRMAA